MSVAMSEGLTRNVSTHAHVRSSREDPKRDIDEPSPVRLSVATVLIQISKPHICLWVTRLSSRRPPLGSPRALAYTCPRRIVQIIPPSPTTPSPPPFDLLFLSYRLKSPLSYYIVLYVQISRKLRDRASIAFFSVSLARPALPLLPVTFSPSKDSRRGSSRRITEHTSFLRWVRI